MSYEYFTWNGIPLNVAQYQQSNYGNMGYTEPSLSLDPKANPDPKSSWWDQYLGGLGKYIQNNPLVPFQAVGNIWNAYTGYKNSKNALALARDNYNLQKQAWEANEARAKEAFNWQRQDRLSHQL